MYEIGVESQFEAAHRLHGNFGPATRTHGHTYRVEAIVRGPALRADGTLCDISLLERVLQDVTTELHYRDLDDVPSLAGKNTTAEVMARHFHDRLWPQLVDQGLETLLVRVWESPQAYAGFEAGLNKSS